MRSWDELESSANPQAQAPQSIPAEVAAIPDTGSNHSVQVDDKRILNCRADLNQLVPIKYDWAWQKYLNSSKNHWMPDEIDMTGDRMLWNSQSGPNCLSDDERLIIKRCLGFFSTADSLVANNLSLAVYEHITNPECRQYLIRQIAEEALHTHSYMHIVQSLGLDEDEIFSMYHSIDSVRKKAEWSIKYTRALTEPTHVDGVIVSDRAVLENLIAFYCVLEGIFFYCGFAQMLALSEHNKMVGSGEQLQYILRDESGHVDFGVDLINQIKHENPTWWDAEMQAKATQMIVEGTELEVEYAQDTMPRGILNMNIESMKLYLEFIADRRLHQLGLPAHYETTTESPFPWLSKQLDQMKEKNFFERRVTEYQTGGAVDWSKDNRTPQVSWN